jgi:hypothetical protein
MDTELGKVAVEVTTKVAETIAPSVVKKVFSFIALGKTRKITQRNERERRLAGERRDSGIDLRLRKGFWLAYHRKTENGKFDVLEINLSSHDQLFQALVKEARNYHFSDRSSGIQLEPTTIIDSAIDVKWAELRNAPKGQCQAILIVESIAEHLLSKYNVTRVDRRKTHRR